MRLTWVSDAKGLAIVAVAVFWHAWGLIGPRPWPHGDVGVDVFVILSGFGLALSHRDENLGSFYRRRLMTLVPKYWICLIVFTVLFAALGIGHITLAGFAIDALLGSLYAPQISFVWWFVTLIAGLYGIYGAIRGIVRRGDAATVLLIGLALELAYSAVTAIVFGHSGWIPNNVADLYIYVDYRIIDFFIGAALAIVYERRFALNAYSAIGCGVLGLLFFYRACSYDWALMLYPAGGLMLLAIFVGFSTGLRAIPSARLAVGAMAFLGAYSYEIYLIHGPIMQSLVPWALSAAHHVTYRALVAGVSLSLAVSCALAVPLNRATLALVPVFEPRSSRAEKQALR
jgi:peptidoglycan/LPS O-acetylase OafA/YrhL